MAQPANNSSQAVAAFIREYIDPQDTFSRNDDAAQAVTALDSIWAEEGGCGVTVEQMAEYLEALPA